MSALRFTARWLALAFNLRGLAGLIRLPVYAGQWFRFKSASNIASPWTDAYPCLSDATLRTGFDPHYFFQAAWLARRLAEAQPARHADIGSDVGMVGVLSAFVPVDFVDLRPIETDLPGLTPKAGNLTALDFASASLASVSCMHVIEHIGLGRYGDPLDPPGHEKAAAELARVLAPGGSLFLSVPVGRERVCFNAHRVFSHGTVERLFPALRLQAFALVDDLGRFHPESSPVQADECDYGCGLFHFVKAAA